MSKSYLQPQIIKVNNPQFLKHGSSAQNYAAVRCEIDGVKIETLIERYGSPLFVFSERQLRNKIREVQTKMNEVYPKAVIGWSYKTNYLNSICKIMHEEGALAEVVSGFEYEKARHIGVEGKQIIFNGPYKKREDLKRALIEKAQIHVDHFDELNDIESIATELQIQPRIGLRLNLNSGIYPQWSRFGFNLESGQARAALQRIQLSKNLRLGGLHCHIGTFILDVLAYRRMIDKMSVFMRECEELLGYQLEFLDLGGGFASKSHLKGVYQPPEVSVPNTSDYIQAIGDGLKWLLTRQECPLVILETGRHLVDEAGYLITQVVADKLLPDGRRSYVLDAGVNLLYTSTWYKFKIELDRPNMGILHPSLLNGPLCMNIDIIDEAIMLPRLRRFQALTLSPVGAYNITQSMQFIQYRPNVVMISLKGETRLIKHAETLEDIIRKEE